MLGHSSLKVNYFSTKQLSQKYISVCQFVAIYGLEHHADDCRLEEILSFRVHIQMHYMHLEIEVLTIVCMLRSHIARIGVRRSRVEMELLRNERHFGLFVIEDMDCRRFKESLLVFVEKEYSAFSDCFGIFKCNTSILIGKGVIALYHVYLAIFPPSFRPDINGTLMSHRTFGRLHVFLVSVLGWSLCQWWLYNLGIYAADVAGDGHGKQTCYACFHFHCSICAKIQD